MLTPEAEAILSALASLSADMAEVKARLGRVEAKLGVVEAKLDAGFAKLLSPVERAEVSRSSSGISSVPAAPSLAAKPGE